MLYRRSFLGSEVIWCRFSLGKKTIGHPQTCVYPDVCLGIAHVPGKAPLSGQGVWQIHNVSAPFALSVVFFVGEGLLGIPGPSWGKQQLPSAYRWQCSGYRTYGCLKSSHRVWSSPRAVSRREYTTRIKSETSAQRVATLPKGPNRSGKSKALVFCRVWSFNMHAPYILSADDLGDFSGNLWEPSILEADNFLGARYRKAMTPKTLCTLLFSNRTKNMQ